MYSTHVSYSPEWLVLMFLVSLFIVLWLLSIRICLNHTSLTYQTLFSRKTIQYNEICNVRQEMAEEALGGKGIRDPSVYRRIILQNKLIAIKPVSTSRFIVVDQHGEKLTIDPTPFSRTGLSSLMHILTSRSAQHAIFDESILKLSKEPR